MYLVLEKRRQDDEVEKSIIECRPEDDIVKIALAQDAVVRGVYDSFDAAQLSAKSKN